MEFLIGKTIWKKSFLLSIVEDNDQPAEIKALNVEHDVASKMHDTVTRIMMELYGQAR